MHHLLKHINQDITDIISKTTMQFYFVVLNMPGLKDSDINIIIILQYENRPVV